MTTERWVAGSGVGFTWTGLFTTAATLNTLPNGSSVLDTADITNQTALDMFADLSISLASITPVAPNYVGVFLYPLNQDGSTYGDGQFASGTQSAAIPAANLWVGNIIAPLVAGVVVGILPRIIIPPGTFRWLFQNNLGVALGSGNTVKYRTYNRQVS